MPLRIPSRRKKPAAAPAPAAATAVATAAPTDPPTSPTVSPTSSPTSTSSTEEPAAEPASDNGTGATATKDGQSGEQPRTRRGWRDAGLLLLLRSAHPKQALLTAAGLAVAAALADREVREWGLVFVTVLIGQSILGWHNDLVDRKRDATHDLPGKPVADGRLDPGTVWFALTCAVLLLVPVALSNGVTAGSAYLMSVAIGLLGNVLFRRGLLSWLPWAASYALYPAFLSYGGWGGPALGEPPEISVTVLAGVLGVCVHLLRALPGLVPDHRDEQRHLPLRIALKTGAARLLWISVVLTALVLGALLYEASRVGLAQ